MNFGTWNVRSVYSVGKASNQNGGTSYTIESLATNNLQQKEGGKTAEQMGRWSTEGAIALLGTRAGNTKPKTENPGCNTIKAKAQPWLLTFM